MLYFEQMQHMTSFRESGCSRFREGPSGNEHRASLAAGHFPETLTFVFVQPATFA
jgi:hypothetical protein